MPNLPTGNKKNWQRPSKRRDQGRIRTETDKFYHTPAWRAVRARFLKLYPFCVECKRKGIIKSGRVVDHITPIKQGGDKLNYSNLQTLCDSCHAKKSGKERHL